MNIYFKSNALHIILLLLWPCYAYADYQTDIDDINNKITKAETVITQRASWITGAQTDIEDYKKSITETKKIYAIGLKKYKGLNDIALEVNKKYISLSSKIFMMRSTYADFQTAWNSYKKAWEDQKYDIMTIEYRKMWHYSHGFDTEPPYKDPVTGFYDARQWYIQQGARWVIRSLSTVVNTINLISTVVDIKSKISEVISVANEGFRSAIDYAKSEAIATVQEAALEKLKTAGSNSSITVSETLLFVDTVTTPLSAAADELNAAVKRIDKKESFGYPSKEIAIEKMTALLNLTGNLYEQALLDAKEVKDELQPIKVKLQGYRELIDERKLYQRIHAQEIQNQKDIIAGLNRERSAIHYTYNISASTCDTFVSGLNVTSSATTLSVDQKTAALLGVPTNAEISAVATYKGCKTQIAICQDANNNDLNVSYNSPYSFTSELDSTTLSGTSSAMLSYDAGKLSAVSPGQGTFVFSLGPMFSQYTTSESNCNTTSSSPSGSGVIEKSITITSLSTSNYYLVPARYKKAQKPVTETFPLTYFTFFQETETPYENEVFYIAYKRNNETFYQYKKIDEIDATAIDLQINTNGVISGEFILDGYIKSYDGSKRIKFASLTMYAEDITPTVSFINYAEKSTSITEGMVPLDKEITTSLILSSGLTPQYGVDDFIKVNLLVSPQINSKDYKDVGFDKTRILLEHFNYMGSSIPLYYEIIVYNADGSHTTLSGNFGEKLIGSIQLDNIYMTDWDKDTHYRSHKNLFYFEKTNRWVDFGRQIHGVTSSGVDYITHFSRSVTDIFFDYLYTIGTRYYPRYNSIIYKKNDTRAIQLIGGQMTTRRNRINEQAGAEENDFTKLNNLGLFLNRNEDSFLAGYNFNVIKLRMREEAGHRYFVLKSMGPTTMDSYRVKWTFDDNSTFNGHFSKNGMIWESMIEPNTNLTEVEVISGGGISLGKLQMANFITEYPSLYGIYEDEFIIRHQTRFEYTNNTYQPKQKNLRFIQNCWTNSTMDVSFPANSTINLTKAAGVDIISIENISEKNGLVEFFIGLFPQLPLAVLEQPSYGNINISSNRVRLSVPPNFTGKTSFKIDLYGALSDPYELNVTRPVSYMKAIESRYLEVTIDFSGAAPILWCTTVYKSPIELSLSMEFDTIITDTANTETAVGSVKVSTINTQMINYKPESISGFSAQDRLKINNELELNLTLYESELGAHTINLPPGKTHILSRKFIQSLFYHLFSGEIETLWLNRVSYVEGFKYILKKNGQKVPYPETGYSMESFDSIEFTYNPPTATIDPEPVGLQLSGFSADGSNKKVFFYFFSQQDEKTIIGDIDNNGTIEIKDLLMTLQMAAGLSQPINTRHDINHDGQIGLAEAIYITRQLSGMQ